MSLFGNWLYRKRAASYDPDAQTYFNNIVANGGTISTASKGYVNTFVLGLKSAGIWPLMAEIYPYMGDQLAAALVKLKYQNTPYLTNYNFVNSDYIETGSGAGLTGDASTKYLDTSFYMDSTLINPTNSEIGIYTKNATSGTFFGYRAGSVNGVYWIFPIGAGGCVYYVGNQDSGYVDFSIRSGLLAVQTNSTNTNLILDGVLKDSSGSYGLYDNTLHVSQLIFAYNPGNGVGQNIGNMTADFMYISQALNPTQSAAFYSLVQALQTSLGRQV